MEMIDADEPAETEQTSRENRANDLTGRDWTKFSISIWSDIRATPQERQLGHPAMFPTMLVERLIRCFTKEADGTILDPFAGSGSTLVAAKSMGRSGVGFEVYENFIALAQERLRQDSLFADAGLRSVIHNRDARQLASVLEPESVDFCVTSPPYWDILTQKRTADYKETRHYGEQANDLGWEKDYRAFIRELRRVFEGVLKVLRPGKYCVVNVMDLRKGPQFFPYHSDLATELVDVGFLFDDLIIWDRRQEYNNLRSLGYPYTFRINKVHEYLLIFQKPKAGS